MKPIRQILSVVALTTIATLVSAHQAQAFSFKVTNGIAGPNGETNQGAYSEFYGLKGTTTVDFNSGNVPTTGFAKYSFDQNDGVSNVRADMWAPTGPNGEKNTSNYLTVFQGNDLTINLEKNLNYFGIDWGAASPGNTYSFYNGDKLIKTYTTQTIEENGGFALYSPLHYGQGNGFVHFYADSAAELFNRIVISSVTPYDGFETDNHSFHTGTGGFDWDKNSKTVATPEPGMAFGALAMVGGLWLRRKQKQNEAL